jgi:ribosome-associated protein
LSSPASREREGRRLEPEEVAAAAARIADEMRARDIVVLEVSDILGIADYFVIATGTSARQLHAVAEEITHVLKRAGTRRLSSDGQDQGSWILLDFGDVVVHLFSDEARSYYDLEHLWEDAGRFDWRSVEIDLAPYRA